MSSHRGMDAGVMIPILKSGQEREDVEDLKPEDADYLAQVQLMTEAQERVQENQREGRSPWDGVSDEAKMALRDYNQRKGVFAAEKPEASVFMMQALPRKTIVKDKARGMARGSRDKDDDDDADEHDVGEAELLAMVAKLEAKMEPDTIFPELRKIIQAVDSKQEVKELLLLMSEKKLNEVRTALNATYQPTIRRSVETIMADALLLKSAPYKEALQTTTRLRTVAMNTASFLLTKNYVNATGFQKARLDEVVQGVQNIKVANMRQAMQNLRSENQELEVKSKGFLGRIFG